MSTTALDLVRSGLVGLAGVILGMVCFVFWTYSTRVAHGDRRLLPKHIVTVSFSYALLIVATAGTQVELIRDDASVTWRLPIIALAYASGVISLRIVMIHLKQRASTPRRRASDP